MSRSSVVAVVLLASLTACKPKAATHAADAAPPVTGPSVPVPPEPPPPQAAKAGEVLSSRRSLPPTRPTKRLGCPSTRGSEPFS